MSTRENYRNLNKISKSISYLWCCPIILQNVTTGGNGINSTWDLSVLFYKTACESMVILVKILSKSKRPRKGRNYKERIQWVVSKKMRKSRSFKERDNAKYISDALLQEREKIIGHAFYFHLLWAQTHLLWMGSTWSQLPRAVPSMPTDCPLIMDHPGAQGDPL